MDVIELRAIRAYGKHGADPEERKRVQPFMLDVRVELDLSAVAQSDDVAQTVDYSTVYQAIVRIVEQHSYALLERLAAEVVTELFKDERIASAAVCVAKPERLTGATPAITLHRKNPSFRGTWP